MNKIQFIDKDLLDLLACPETRKNLVIAESEVVEKLNKMIAQGKVLNRSKEKVVQRIDGGLFREGDRKYLYPIRKGVPILIIEEMIEVN